MSRVTVQDIGKVSLERVNQILGGSFKTDVWKAAHNALLRAGDTARAQAGRFATAEYMISKGAFDANTKTKTKLEGGYSAGGVTSMTVSFAGSVIPLLTFNTRYSRGGGLMFAQVKRGGGGGTLRHVFTANIGGRLGAFERKGKSRFPVEGKYGPSTAHMMQNEKVTEEMSKTIEETYDRRIEHEITRILSGYGG